MKILAKNTRANFDYSIKQTFTAGMVLSGPEVKSVKSGNVSLTGAYVTVSPGSVSLINCHIGPYKYAPSETYNPTHSRNLLLNKKEISELLRSGQKGLVKITIGLGKARKKLDKREYIKNRDTQKEIRQHINK